MQAVFVDSNILIYSQDATDPRRRAQARGWLDQLWRTRFGRISYQVLREVYLSLTVLRVRGSGFGFGVWRAHDAIISLAF
jgi:hypothetical protein